MGGTKSNKTKGIIIIIIILMESLQFLKWYEKYTTMHLQHSIIVDIINYISILQIGKLQQTWSGFPLIINRES